MKTTKLVWTARVFIAIVLFINLLCAVEFILKPSEYMGSYELSGEVGRVVMIGYGILFLMWQVPYFFALANPVKHKISLFQANLMQAVGLIGETLLLRTIPAEFAILRGSVTRFIIFDAVGLVFLIVAAILIGLGKSQLHRSDLKPEI